jgi:hypothetical protein
MKILHSKSFLAGGRFPSGLFSLAVIFLAGHTARAHLTYSGRDFGSFSGLTNATASITNQAVTGNYGWADAADGILGDSHRARAFRFHLENEALVTLTAAANPTATTNSLGGFTPAFSVYAGLGAVAPFPASQTANPSAADHDGSDASIAWRTWWVQQNIDPAAIDESATDGSWNALGDWKIGGDGDLPGDFSQLSTFIYKISAASTTSGGSVTRSLVLPAGDYTVLIGGNDILNKTSNTALAAYGISATLTVSSAPILSIAPKVFVAWSAEIPADWVLQSSLKIIPATWTAVTNTPVVVDGVKGVLLEFGARGSYFRFNEAP